MVRVPRNYSICILLSIVTYKALSSGCANWGRTAFYILSLYAIAVSFPLYAGTQYFAVTSTNDYINSLAWVSSVYFMVLFGAAGAPTASALDLCVCEEAPAAEAAAAKEEPATTNEPAAAADEGAANA